ncbi:MAG: UvrD-helicase domain-containing protein, partial [Crocinitomicaceae bacterium]|nr:UvrD-helicase domain-containing protein [Crocinitomicaceae bacterium]
MDSANYKPLKIYNASAGSGKTYHLVKEYIQLLISTETGGSAFSNIIAMTFTNKAALEMKERIILALDQIAHPERFGKKGDSLTNELSTSLNISTKTVVSRTQMALRLILHHYEDFHVMTIDKFNLRLIKSFGRDLDLPSDFEVVMDETSLIEQVVDDLMNQLGTESAGVLNDLMFQYAKSNVEDGNSWNFRRELVLFGKVLNSEKNQPIIDRLMTMDFSMEQFGRLHHRKKQLDQASLLLGSKITEQLNTHSLKANELPGKSRTMNGIVKMASVQMFPLDEKIIGKSVLTAIESDLKSGQRFPDELKQAIQEFINYRLEQLEE